MAHYAGLLAQTLGWPAERVERLCEAALLHDVGKIGVPDSVLLNPRELSDREWEYLHRHPELSAEIAGEVLDSEQAGWIRSHHERPDGTGYSDGLSGERIADGARLIGLADAWDAMTTVRPHREARPVEEALRECRAAAALQFDAAAVDALERLARAGALDPAEVRRALES